MLDANAKIMKSYQGSSSSTHECEPVALVCSTNQKMPQLCVPSLMALVSVSLFLHRLERGEMSYVPRILFLIITINDVFDIASVKMFLLCFDTVLVYIIIEGLVFKSII